MNCRDSEGVGLQVSDTAIGRKSARPFSELRIVLCADSLRALVVDNPDYRVEAYERCQRKLDADAQLVDTAVWPDEATFNPCDTVKQFHESVI